MSDVTSELASSWENYRVLADNSIDVIIEVGLDSECTWVSPSVTQVLGWRPEDFIGTRTTDLVHPDDLPRLQQYAEAMEAVDSPKAAQSSAMYANVRLRAANGDYRSLRFRATPVFDSDGSRRGRIVTLKDSSDRDEALRALSVLTEANRAIAIAEDEDELLGGICATIAQAGMYPLAWYGVPVQDDRQTVIIAAAAGVALDYLSDLDISWGNRPEGLGPTGTCLRTDSTQVVADIMISHQYLPWRERAAQFALRSAVSLPVRVDGELDGALVVAATEINSFDQDALRLLETVASDLGLGLERVRATRLLKEQSVLLRESEARYRLLAEHASDVVLRAPVNHGIDWVSESAQAFFGWTPQDMFGKRWDFAHPDDVELARAAQAALDRTGQYDTELRVACADGSNKWVRMLVHRVATDEGEFDIAALQDIDKEVRARRELDFALGHDPLTGMPARPAMTERVAAALQSLGDSEQAALLCLSVDRLSAVNEAYTHTVGDVVLTTFATRLVEATRSLGASRNPDLVGRGNGVEFVLLVPHVTAGDEAAQLAERLLAIAREPFNAGDARINVTASIGIAVGGRGDDADQMMRDASAAMRLAKTDGRDRYSFSDPELVEQARRYLEVEQHIKEALDQNAFVARFQPIVDLATGEVTGYETLVHSRGEDGRPLAEAGDFMPVAERTGLVCDIDLVMLEAGLTALLELPPPLTISVNLSTLTMTRAGYLNRVRDLVVASGVRPSRLHLEVTETSLLGESDAVTAGMTALAELGARWYVDDFGTGYSSISHLRDLPISGLKLDVSFSKGVREGHPRSVRLANALVGLARGLGLDTVAEGIETDAEAEVLLSQGWRHGQGYLFGSGEPLS